MLKKIVKYGNSSALVLDKALLELLNMAEGSVVKIKTDGVSLIITPQHALVQETISPTLTLEETLKDAIKTNLEKSFGDPEKAARYQEGLKEITGRYLKMREQKMATPEMQQAMAAVQKRFAGDEANPEYVKAIQELHRKNIPEMEQMNREIDAFVKKYSPEQAHAVDMRACREDFAKVHGKYQHLLLAVSKLGENSEYLHEQMQLAEKYQATKESKEYFEAYTQLIVKYIPEYAAYQEELKKVAEAFNPQAKKIAAPARRGRKQSSV
jgi:antitoxin component of MazEF toxin-antitoxin module